MMDARAFALALATAAGCGGAAFTGMSPEGGPADASSPTSDAGSGAPSDASGEGQPSEASTRWCSTRRDFFCDDFDESSNVTAELNSSSWTSYSQSNGGFGFFTGIDVPSAPNALSVRASDHANVLVVREFTNIGHPLRARLEFALRITSPGNVGPLAAAGFAAIGIGATSADGVVAISIGNGPALAALWLAPADAGSGSTAMYGIGPAKGPFPQTGIWSGRYAIDVTYSPNQMGTGQGACAQIYEGASALLQQCLQLPAVLANPKVLSIALGVVSGGSGVTGNVELAFDNVTFNLQ